MKEQQDPIDFSLFNTILMIKVKYILISKMIKS